MYIRQQLRTLSALVLATASSLAAATGVLVVAPHPDDDLLIASGVIANAKARGDQVKVVFMTNGDANGVSEGYAREIEAVNAQTQHLGTLESDLLFLGYPDGGLDQVYANYPNNSDQYWGQNGRSTTYGARGLGGSDYHTYKFGAPAFYNRANVVTDLKDILQTYRPDHILTTAEFDQHPDHAATYQMVAQAVAEIALEHPEYHPTLHKTVVWDAPLEQPAVWPETLNPAAYHVVPPALPVNTAWASRESIDVPLAMQSFELTENPKYLAIDTHASQGGGQSFLGRFVHKDEFFWIDAVAGGATTPRVDAGVSQTVAAGAAVQLNGSASVGAGLTYSWRQIGGAPVVLTGANTANPSFTAPTVMLHDEVLSFELVVSSGGKASLPDLVVVTALEDNDSSENIAPDAAVTASSQNSADGQLAVRVVDGVVDGYPGDYTREWAADGQQSGAWIQLQWAHPVTIGRVVLFDRPNDNDQILSGTLTFSDGSSVPVSVLPNDGAAREVRFSSRTVSSVRFTVDSTSATSQNIGLAEFQVYGESAGGNVNQPPVASVGQNQTVASGATVQLSGVGSSDPDGQALGYHWTQVGGNTVTISSETAQSPTFTAPTGLAQDAVLVFQLIVDDGVLQSQPATVSVTVLAAAVPSTNIAPQATVTASSQNSADGQVALSAIDGIVDGWPGDYHREWATAGQGVGAWIQLNWAAPVNVNRIVLFDRPNTNDQITGGTLTFSDGSSVAVSALNNTGGATEFTFAARQITSVRLTVTSVSSNSANIGLAEMQVFASSGGAPAGNQVPTANAGSAQTVAQGALVQLDGSASSDPEAAALTYHWHQVGGPAVTLSSANEVRPMFVAPTGLTQTTTLSFELVVNDGTNNSAPAIANVIVNAGQAAINIAPQATVLSSSENAADSQLAIKAVDGVISGYPGDYTREWATAHQGVGAWIELRWGTPQIVERVVLYDRPNTNDQITGATLTFSDGSSVSVPALNNDGTATTVTFTPRAITSVRLTVNSVSVNTGNVGLSEFQVYGTSAP